MGEGTQATLQVETQGNFIFKHTVQTQDITF